MIDNIYVLAGGAALAIGSTAVGVVLRRKHVEMRREERKCHRCFSKNVKHYSGMFLLTEDMWHSITVNECRDCRTAEEQRAVRLKQQPDPSRFIEVVKEEQKSFSWWKLAWRKFFHADQFKWSRTFFTLISNSPSKAGVEVMMKHFEQRNIRRATNISSSHPGAGPFKLLSPRQ